MMRSRRWYLLIGGLLVAAVLFVALFADHITAVSPTYMDAKTSIIEGGSPPWGPGPGHIFGTDAFGRDIWSRVAYGARWSLLFAFLIMAARLLVALPMAVAAAFGSRFVGWVTSRLYIYTSAIPPLLVYILILSSNTLREIGLWPSVIFTVILLTLVEWPRLTVVLQGRLEELMGEQFVEGAVAAGATRWHIFWVHLMPHLWSTLLNLAVAEIGRGLLVIAQLGIFGIWVGGGIWDITEDARGNELWIRTTGVPEWGTLLADSRKYIYSAPWIPLPPAFAFFVGVVGFNMLSQGLEGINFSLTRIKELTTGRLSKRWRVAWVAVPLIAVLLYNQGLPWGKAQAVSALARQQTRAATEKSLDGFLATVEPGATEYRDVMSRWLQGAFQTTPEVVVVRPQQVNIAGSTATGMWTVSYGFKDRPPLSVTNSVRLDRLWGRWRIAGEAFTTLRGMHVDLDAFYQPLDPSRDAVQNRWNIHFLATALDHAFEAVVPLFPAGGGRPRAKLYPSREAFLAAVGEGAGTATVWSVPGEPLRISPDFLKGLNRRDIEKALSLEMMKYLTVTRLHAPGALPIVIGGFELKAGQGAGEYRIDFDKLTGAALLPLPDLFKLNGADLTQDRMPVYAVQSALLVEFLKAKLDQPAMLAAVSGSSDALATLAKAAGTSGDQLSGDYNAYVRKRISDASTLNLTAGRERIPVALTDAVAAQNKAAVVLDAEVKDGKAKVYVFDPTESRVAIHQWVQQDDRWVMEGN